MVLFDVDAMETRLCFSGRILSFALANLKCGNGIQMGQRCVYSELVDQRSPNDVVGL
jgi:hypothetical protein